MHRFAGGSYLPATLRGNSLLTQALDVHALAAISYEMLTGIKPKGEDGYYSPSVINAAIQERAGETVLLGLRAFDARTGLTASQFSHALTHWRSWTMQQSHDPGDSSRGNGLGAVPTMPPISPPYAWPQIDQPSRVERSSAQTDQG